MSKEELTSDYMEDDTFEEDYYQEHTTENLVSQDSFDVPENLDLTADEEYVISPTEELTGHHTEDYDDYNVADVDDETDLYEYIQGTRIKRYNRKGSCLHADTSAYCN